MLRTGKFLRRRVRLGRRSVPVGVILAIGLGLVIGGGAVYARLGGFTNDPVTSINLQKGLIGWWKLDGNGKDGTPYTQNGMPYNGIAAGADRKGQSGKAMTLDGLNDYVHVPDTERMKYRGGNMSYSVWFNADPSETSGRILSKPWNGSGGYNYTLLLTGTSLQVAMQGATSYSLATVPVTKGVWNHAVVTMESTGVIKLYVNGQLAQSGTSTISDWTIADSSLALAIGTLYPYGGSWAGSTAHAFNGQIDDVRLYDRTLNADEARALHETYDSGINAASGEKGLLAWWKFDGNTKDATPYSRSLVATDTTLSVDRKGLANAAYGFNGTSSNMTSSLIPAITRTGNYSVSTWVKSSSTADQMIWQNSANCSDRNGMGIRGNDAYFSYYDGAAYTTKRGSLVAGEWNHLVAVNTGGTLTLYVNGVPQSTTTSNIYAHCTPGLWIGSTSISSTPQWLNGTIDDFRVYNRSLDQGDVSRLYTSYNSQINLNSSPSASQAYNLNSGLAAYWPFSGNARDATPYQRDGTVSGASLTTDRKGQANRAYSFNGSSNLIDFGTGADYDSSDFTVSVWAKSNVAIPAHVTNLVGKGNWNAANSWYIGFRSGPSLSFVYGSTWNTGPTYAVSNFDTTQWHHYVGVATASQLKLYLDGNLVATTNLVHGTAANTFPLQIGRSSYANTYFNGAVDDVRLYKRALSQAEVSALYSY